MHYIYINFIQTIEWYNLLFYFVISWISWYTALLAALKKTKKKQKGFFTCVHVSLNIGFLIYM